jgi:hypothetical protein
VALRVTIRQNRKSKSGKGRGGEATPAYFYQELPLTTFDDKKFNDGIVR